MKLLLIYNSHAGGKRAKKVFPEVKNYFAQKDFEVDILFTEYKGHGTELVKNADLKSYNGVIASGGDGTLFEVVNGYYLNSADVKPPVGLIPNGTGNAFAKELNLKSFEWANAIDIIAENKAKRIDVNRFVTEGQTYYSINIIGIGFPVDVGQTVEKLKFLGEVSYLVGVLYHIIFLKSFEATLETGQETYQKNITFIELANSVYTGSTFVMAPQAKTDDGLIDVVIVDKLNRRRILKLLPTIFSGKHIFEKEVEVLKVKKISINTLPAKSIIPDGELFGKTPLTIECLHKDLDFFMP
jgi:diacylglycerol kinase (ATP)